jgi:hypothetical protein
MDYESGPVGHFDCDDYAWCFYDVCEDLGIPAWQFPFSFTMSYRFVKETPPHPSVYDYWCAYVGSSTAPEACWFQDPSETSPNPPSGIGINETGGHVANIVKLPSPTETVHDYYCLVEPQTNRVYGCWYQDSSTSTPTVPDFIIEALVEHWGFDEIFPEDIWEAGHSECAGEAAFTNDPVAVERYEDETGYDAPE